MVETDTLLKQLASDDSEIIREGAFSAGQARSKEAIPFLVEHLASENLGVQEAADMALRKIGGAETVEAVIPSLRSDAAPVRNLAMDILREIGSHDFSQLVRLIKDADADIRIFISDILGSSKKRMAVAPLCEALLKDPEVNVRYQAAVSLGNLAFSEAADCLNRAMGDEEWVQFAVIEALTKIRDESSVNALASALDSSTDLVGSMIVEALGEMGNHKAVSLLLKRIEASPTALRNKMIKAIVKIMGGKSLALLSNAEKDNIRGYMLDALQDEEIDIQDAAIEGLGAVGGEEASARVLDLAAGLDPVKDQERLEFIAKSLAYIGLTPALEEAVKTGSWKTGMVAIQTVMKINKPELAPLLMDVFWEKDLDMQREMIVTLDRIADESAEDFFLDVLDRHNDGKVLKPALHFLGQKIQSVQSGEKLFSMLEFPYDDVKEVALDSCVALGGEEMNQRFKTLFQSSDPMNRYMAVYALGRLVPGGNLEELRLALEDEVPDVRKMALDTMRETCSEEQVSMAVPRLQDESKEVRGAVVELLGGCLSSFVTKYLIQALEDEDDWVVVRAVEALAQRGEVQAVGRLVDLLDTAGTLVCLKVVEALGEIGGEECFQALFKIMSHEDPEMVATAETALARIKEKEEQR